MKRKIYTTPRTELFRVELEGTFASSATGRDVTTGSVTTTGHELNTIEGGTYGEDGSFSAADWNDGVWN